MLGLKLNHVSKWATGISVHIIWWRDFLNCIQTISQHKIIHDHRLHKPCLCTYNSCADHYINHRLYITMTRCMELLCCLFDGRYIVTKSHLAWNYRPLEKPIRAPSHHQTTQITDLNMLRFGQNGWRLSDVFKSIFFKEIFTTLFRCWLNWPPANIGSIDGLSGDKPLSGPMKTKFTDSNMRHQYGPVIMILPASGHQVRCIPWVQMGTFNKEIGFYMD